MNLPAPPSVGQGWSAQAIEAIWQKLQPKVKSIGYSPTPQRDVRASLRSPPSARRCATS
jgi:hypothetical protein